MSSTEDYEWLASWRTLHGVLLGRNRSSTHPLVTHYLNFPKTDRDAVMAAIDNWLHKAKEIDGFDKWLVRFHNENQLANVWSYLSELAIGDYLLQRATKVEFCDQTGPDGDRPPDFKATVDGQPVWIETQIILHEYAVELELDDLICKASHRLSNALRLETNSSERFRNIAQLYAESDEIRRSALRQFRNEADCFSRVLSETDLSAIKPGPFFAGHILKVFVVDPNAEEVCGALPTPPLFQQDTLKGILLGHIQSKAAKKNSSGRRPYVILMDFRVLRLFQREWPRLLEWGNCNFDLPENIDGVVFLRTDFSGQSVSVLGTIGDGGGLMTKLVDCK
jgi:hypothetical protein